jgi:hypothetical protein
VADAFARRGARTDRGKPTAGAVRHTCHYEYQDKVIAR